VSEALGAGDRGEVEDRRTLGPVAEGADRVLEHTLECHLLGRPRGGGDVLEPPLHDEAREASEREVLQVELPRRSERVARVVVTCR
jgi:hypothetical protein